MKLQQYLSEYSESHQNRTNIVIHQVCVPAIMWSVLAFLNTFWITSDWSLAHLFVVGVLVFYATLKNWKIVALMFGFVVLSFASFIFIKNLRMVSIIVFVIGWIGQFYGHKVEGKKPSFLKDLFFLLIGPIWVFKKWIPSLTN